MSTSLKRPSTLQPGERVLVTAANSYIGSHIVDLLLSMGYLVRGTIREEKPWLDEYFTSKYGPGKYESVIVPDVGQKDSLVKVLENISGLLHVATDLSFTTDTEKVINGVIKATQVMLEAAAEQKFIKRVILTSSSSAAILPKPNVDGIVVTEDSWNDEVVKIAWEGTPATRSPMHVYSASKTEGERFAHKWVRENNPQFVFNTVLPNFAVGRFLHPKFNGSSGKNIVDLLEGKSLVMQHVPPEYYINVEDVARIHAIALLDPDIKSERLFAFASPFTWTDIIHILRKYRPENDKLPSPPENEGEDLSVILPAKRAEDLLKLWFDRPGWVPFEQSVKDALDTSGL